MKMGWIYRGMCCRHNSNLVLVLIGFAVLRRHCAKAEQKD